MNPVPRFSVAVMVYSSDFPVLTPAGILLAQVKTPAVAAQRHTGVTGLMPGPASVDLTFFAAAKVAAMVFVIETPAALVSLNRTVIVRADFATVLPATGDLNAPIP
jgi:hypothetical protein